MKPEQFIRDWGLPEAKRIINESPEWASEWCMDCKDYINYCDSDVVSDCESCVSIAGLERLVESLDIISDLDGIDAAKGTLAELIKLDWDEFEHRWIDNWMCTRPRLEQAIRDHESIYGGGHV